MLLGFFALYEGYTLDETRKLIKANAPKPTAVESYSQAQSARAKLSDTLVETYQPKTNHEASSKGGEAKENQENKQELSYKKPEGPLL